jgi:transposase-like protein
MVDALTTVHCPRCLAPAVEFIWHPRGVLSPPVSRFECHACDWSSDGHVLKPHKTTDRRGSDEVRVAPALSGRPTPGESWRKG